MRSNFGKQAEVRFFHLSSLLPPLFQLLTVIYSHRTQRKTLALKEKKIQVCLLELVSSVGKFGGAGLFKANCCVNTPASSISTFQSTGLAAFNPLNRLEHSGWYCLLMAREDLGKWGYRGWGILFPAPVRFSLMDLKPGRLNSV